MPHNLLIRLYRLGSLPRSLPMVLGSESQHLIGTHLSVQVSTSEPESPKALADEDEAEAGPDSGVPSVYEAHLIKVNMCLCPTLYVKKYSTCVLCTTFQQTEGGSDIQEKHQQVAHETLLEPLPAAYKSQDIALRRLNEKLIQSQIPLLMAVDTFPRSIPRSRGIAWLS